MIRRAFVFLHRWVGLALALFLIIEGATGGLMAFYMDLTNLLDPSLVASRPSPEARPLDPATLAERADAIRPHAKFQYFESVNDEQVIVQLAPRTDPETGKPYATHDADAYVLLDPWTGNELGKYGVYKQGFVANIMPFIYMLHVNLTLGPTGLWIFSIVALLWTIDCFAGFYLTLPLKLESFWRRWKPAWLIKWRGGFYRVNFDLHRAGGLWLWAMLFVFAWSSFQLTDGSGFYDFVMGKLFDYRTTQEELKFLTPSSSKTGPFKLDLRAAQTAGEKLMAELAQREGFKIEKPLALNRFEDSRQYQYVVRTDRGFPNDRDERVLLDADTGAFHATWQTNTGHAGNTVSNWLRALHMITGPADWLAYRIFVVVIGIVIVMLSGTGVYVWWKKRKARIHANSRSASATAPLTPQTRISTSASIG
ncbi:MAG: PepSY-associated TM helix domain-containing protein [Beijerinckiaceae bacterium]